MTFQIEEIYEKQDFAGLIRAARYQKSKGKRGRKLRNILKAILAAWILGAGLWGCLQIFAGYGEIVGDAGVAGALSAVLPCVVLIACGVGLLISLAGKSPFAAGMAWKNYRDRGKLLTYRLSDTEISCHIPGSDLTFDYVLVQSVLEDRERYYLFMDQRSAHILKKTKFMQGAPDEFHTFISQKTGKPVEYIK